MSSTRAVKSRLLPPCCVRSICAAWWEVPMPCLIAVPSARRSCRRMGIIVFPVKENEKGFYQDIEVLFQPHRKRAGTSAPPMDFRRSSTVEKGHGRLDKRSIIVSSLPAHLADPKRLLALKRGHWGIENGLHYRRDVTFHEDHAQLRMGHAPEMLAVLNNIVLGLFARQGETNMAHARRDFAYHLDKVLVRLLA